MRIRTRMFTSRNKSGVVIRITVIVLMLFTIIGKLIFSQSHGQQDSHELRLTYNLNLTYNSLASDFNEGEKFKWLMSFFGNKTRGRFLEVGSTSAHILYLEQVLNWTGIIVDCNPKPDSNASKSIIRYRKARIAKVCLGSSKKMKREGRRLLKSSPDEIFANGEESFTNSVGTTRKTVPLNNVLVAAKMYKIDYFSFFVNEAEVIFSVLESFPFRTVRFSVIIINVNNSDLTKEAQEREEKFLFKKGFSFVNLPMIFIDRVYIRNEIIGIE